MSDKLPYSQVVRQCALTARCVSSNLTRATIRNYPLIFKGFCLFSSFTSYLPLVFFRLFNKLTVSFCLLLEYTLDISNKSDNNLYITGATNSSYIFVCRSIQNWAENPYFIKVATFGCFFSLLLDKNKIRKIFFLKWHFLAIFPLLVYH